MKQVPWKMLTVLVGKNDQISLSPNIVKPPLSPAGVHLSSADPPATASSGADIIDRLPTVANDSMAAMVGPLPLLVGDTSLTTLTTRPSRQFGLPLRMAQT